MAPFELSNLFGRYLDLVLVAKREKKKRHECAEQAQAGHPPDVPDQREASHNSEERVDETDGLFFGASIGLYSGVGAG